MITQKTVNSVWLARVRVTDGPEGDRIADMRTDFARDPDSFPAMFSNIAEMRGYLRTRRACHEVLYAVPGVWRRYRRVRAWQGSSGCGTVRVSVTASGSILEGRPRKNCSDEEQLSRVNLDTLASIVSSQVDAARRPPARRHADKGGDHGE